jgi:Dimerisation domain of Ca+-activated chloride-channel, anoctamin
MDQELTIDYVLVYESMESSKVHTRSQFENKLKQAGLILSKEEVEMSHESAEGQQNLNFVKIHAPNDVLEEYSERLKMKMPMTITERRCSLRYEKQPFWSYADSTSTRVLKSVFFKAKRDL